jgi:hypothetical protein
MKVFTSRREAILAIYEIENKSDLIIFMGKMVKTINLNILSDLDRSMVADELSKNTRHIFTN